MRIKQSLPGCSGQMCYRRQLWTACWLRNPGRVPSHVHSHIIDDSPHLFFMHFWANDDAQKLARGLRAARALANVKRGS